MNVDMTQIWQTIFSKETIGIIVLLIGVFMVRILMKKMNKMVLAVIVLGAFAGVCYVFFPGFVEVGTAFMQGSWMD
mgnify:CR=1 FL=1